MAYKKTSSFLLLAIWFLSICSGSMVTTVAQAQVASKAAKTARLNQTHRSAITVIESVLAGTNVPVMNTLSGPVGATGAGLTMLPTRTASTTASLPSVPVLAIADGSSSKDQILQSAKTNIMGQASTVSAALKALMASSGHKFGNFIFEQSIKPASSTSYVKVVWQLTILESGRVFYADPRITDPDPVYVSAVYTSKAVAAGLPSSWAYPDGGKLKWWLSKKDGTPMSATTVIDVAGAFDMPLVSDSTVYDPDWGMKCLVNQSSAANCPPATSGFKDINQLIKDTNSAGAVIDYVRKLQPIYDDSVDGAGLPIKVARLAMSIDSRSLTPVDCEQVNYRNTGRYGFALDESMDRFIVKDIFTPPVFVKRLTQSSFSPTQSYDFTVNTSVTSSDLQSKVINPFDYTGPLVSTASISNLSYLAPLSVDDSFRNQIYVTGYGQGGGNGYGGESIDVSTSWLGNTFVLSMSTPWIEGYDDGRVIRDTYIDINVPLCQIESISIVSSGAVQGQVIFVNGSAASATDLLSSYLFDSGCDSDGCAFLSPRGQAMVPYITRPFAWGELNGNSNAYWHGHSSLPIEIKPKFVAGGNRLLFQHLTFHGSNSAAQINFTLKSY